MVRKSDKKYEFGKIKLNVKDITNKKITGCTNISIRTKEKANSEEKSCNQKASVNSGASVIKCWSDISKMKDEKNDETGDDESELKER